MTERSPHTTSWTAESHLAELAAEAKACVDLDERGLIAADIDRIQVSLRRAESSADSIAALPSLWESIYGGETADERYVALFSGSRAPGAARLASITQAYFAWPREVRVAQRWVSQTVSDDREVYHCAHLLLQPSRRKASAAPLSALYVDLDDGLLLPQIPEPTLLIESSPNRFQAYWSLVEPVHPVLGERLNWRLAQVLGADRSGWDLTQLLRVPGSANHKYPDAPLVRVRSDTARSYVVEEFMDLLANSSETLSTEPPTQLDGQLPPTLGEMWVPSRLSRTAQQIWEGQGVRQTPDGRVDRSVALVQIARILSGAGMSQPEIAAALAERDIALGWRKYTGRPDAPERYATIAHLVAGNRNRQA